jgi:hypothetical protein
MSCTTITALSLSSLHVYNHLSEYLETQHLFLAVKDASTKKRELEDLGYAAISLRSACGDSKKAFEAKLYIKGLQRGVLRGSIHVVWPDSSTSHKGYAQILPHTLTLTLARTLTLKCYPSPTVHSFSKCGYLIVKDKKRGSKKRRWFVLSKSILCYYSTDLVCIAYVHTIGYRCGWRNTDRLAASRYTIGGKDH